MAHWPLPGPPGGLTTIPDGNPTYTHSHVVTGTTGGLKGAWTPVPQFTIPPDVTGVWLSVRGSSASSSDSSMLLDLGVGPPGAEVVVVPDIAAGWALSSRQLETFLPIALPEGPLAFRVASAIASDSVTVTFALQRNGNAAPARRAVALGANPATTKGVLLPQVTQSAVWAAWGELTAATPFDIHYIGLTYGWNQSTISSSTSYAIDLGVGPAGSEVSLMPYLAATVQSNTAEYLYSNALAAPTTLAPVSIPAGTRVAARVLGTNTHYFNVIAHGFGR